MTLEALKQSENANCADCGSPRGDNVRFCNECIENKIAMRTTYKSQNISVPKTSEITVGSSGFSDADLIKACAASGACFFLFVGLLIFSPVKSLVGALAAAVLVISVLAALTTWVFLWLEMIMNDTMWALACFLFPGFIYRYVYLRWSEVKYLSIIHIVAIGFAIAAMILFYSFETISLSFLGLDNLMIMWLF